MSTISPILTLREGEMWAGRFLCLFSYLLYLGTQWRQSRRTMMVRCILVEMTTPFSILPRIETLLVKGHFLSMQLPSMAYLGVLKLRPAFLQYLTPEAVFLASSFLELRKMGSCFWKALCCWVKEKVLGYQPWCGIIIILINKSKIIYQTGPPRCPPHYRFQTCLQQLFRNKGMVRIIQNYTLYEIIGQGAYGKVYRAINKNDNKEYAVKVIEVRRFKENKKLEECTVNEINILTNIEKNEHIIKYIDMLKTPNNFYFVYEYCNGGTLEGMLRKDRVVPEKQALLIFKQLIDAFQVLNKYNIMHRDLKPDNIFFNAGVVKLGDFGFCKSLEKANMTKTMLGSPIYMAPEILRGEIYSTKADIWSLGVVLYEMLYGFCPFESTTIPKLIQVLKQTELQFPNKQPVTQQTKRLLRRLLTKDPTKRIEWMQLLRINITNDGRLVGNKQERLSLVEEDGNALDSAKLAESTKFTPKEQEPKKSDNLNNSTQSYSPPSVHSEPNLSNLQGSNSQSSQGASFLKKKNTYEGATSFGQSNARRNSTQIGQGQGELFDPNLKRVILKQHGQATRGLHIAVDLIKSNDTNSVLFAFLILKKAEQKLVAIRDEVANFSEFKQLLMCFNSELKEISLQLTKYNISENPQNWKALVKATGEFHRNYRAFYMMVVFLAGQIPRDDLSHVEMQLEVRNKLY